MCWLPQGEGRPGVAVGKLLGEAEGVQGARSVVVSQQWRDHGSGSLEPDTWKEIRFSNSEL